MIAKSKAKVKWKMECELWMSPSPPEGPTQLAEWASEHFGEPGWCDDPSHWVWDLAAELFDDNLEPVRHAT